VETSEAIAGRRSIRKFKSDPVPEVVLERILTAATLAPSGKNAQPWRFVVVRAAKRAEMAQIMRQGIARMQAQGAKVGSSPLSADIMEAAPVTVFVFNAEGKHPWLPRSVDEAFLDLVNAQSVGAAIENLCLAAQSLGLGSLWICDVFFAYQELCTWLGQETQLVAAVSVGYAAENPSPRPRKPLSEITVWL
jgi:nitroreductase